MGEILRTLALFAAFGAYLAFLILFHSAQGTRTSLGKAMTLVLVTWLIDRAMLLVFTAIALLWRSPPLWVWSLPDFIVAIAAIVLLVQTVGLGRLWQARSEEGISSE